MGILRFLLILATSLSLATMAQAKRVALVIGNSKYEHAQPLPNPVRDATAMAEKLRSLGFETVEGHDLDFDGMRSTLRDFARQARTADIATIFYAGHGIAVDGVNYLIPVDAQLDDPVDWEFQVYDIEEFLRHVRHAKGASLIFLDACRDNPLAETLARSMGKSTRSVGGRGLARIDVDSGASGMAIAFATSPGEVALDGEGDHSPFTSALLKYIGQPNTDISEVMSRVTGDVFESTDRAQRPWINASLTGPVVLNPVNTMGLAGTSNAVTPDATAPQPAPTATASIDVQKFMFDAARETGDPADFQAYLDMFPDGLFAQMARNALRRLDEESAPQQPAAVPQQVASVSPNVQSPQPTQVQPNDAGQSTAIATRSLAAPLQLEVTQAVRTMLSNGNTETMLNLTRAEKREIQGRLNAVGHNVGGADGAFGPKTRRGITSWQTQNGIIPTGYLNAVQHQLLVANSEAQYQTWLTSRPVATAPKAKRRTTAKRQTTRRKTTRRRSNDAAVAGAIAGFAAGVLLGRR